MAPLLTPQYVTDENGQRVAVILSISQFEEISELLEDLSDATVIKQRRSEQSIPHQEAMRRVREDSALPD